MIKVGIIGFGNQGKYYTDLLLNGSNNEKIENAKLVAICDTDPVVLSSLEGKLSNISIFDNYITLLDSGEVDAIFIEVPHYFHPEIAMNAMKRGIHVMCDKPAGVYTKQVLEMNEFSLQYPDVTFAMMLNQRTNPLYIKLKESIDSGLIGEIRSIDWIVTSWWRPQIYYNSGAWRATWDGEGGGVLINQGPHHIDLWQWFFGLPDKVFANLNFGYKRDIKVEDDICAIMTYKNGATGTFRINTHDYLGTDRLEITGSKGKILIEGEPEIKVRILPQTEEELNVILKKDYPDDLFGEKLRKVVEVKEETYDFLPQKTTQHFVIIQNFINAIEQGEPLIAQGCEGINGLRLSNAIYLSGFLKEQVSINFDDDLFLEELNKLRGM